MERLTLQQLTDDILKSFDNYDKQGTTHWDYKIAAWDLQYQIGSLTKLMLQREGHRWADNQTPEEIKAKIGDELADILAETVFIAHELDIDLARAWQKMLESDTRKVSERTDK